MKQLTMLALAAMLAGMAGNGWAADTGTITVTVSLESTISVSLDKTAWSLGPVATGSTSAAETFTADVGNTATKLEISGADAAGGWVLDTTAGADKFVVSVADTGPLFSLTTANQTLAAAVPAYGAKEFSLTYSAPTSDTKGAGVNQGFSVTVTASAP